MGEPVRFKIRGSGENDAPTVEDFLDQVRDFIAVLRGVEAAMDENGESAIEWRITNASKNSPIGIEATPYARQHAVDVTARANEVRRYAAAGFRALGDRAEQPAFFNRGLLTKVQKVAKRVTNGLASTEVDFGEGVGELVITPVVADATVRNTEAILKPPKARPYKEAGTVEGYYKALETDEHGHAILQIRNRRTGDTVKCRVTGEALEEIRARRVAEVLDHRRLRVRGILFYKQRGKIDRVVADTVQFMPTPDELPTLNDIIDPDYTSGLSSFEFLEAVRGRLS